MAHFEDLKFPTGFTYFLLPATNNNYDQMVVFIPLSFRKVGRNSSQEIHRKCTRRESVENSRLKEDRRY